MSIVILIIGILAIALGYGLYAKRIDRNIIQPDDKKSTPAKMYMDGVDFTPANRNVLFGYQFKSIAALGPIVGPIVAIRYGWLPALLWIILGTSFIGWVQDYASIVVGVREEGQTFGALSYRLITPRARSILLIFIYAYLLLIMGAFGKIVGYDLMSNGVAGRPDDLQMETGHHPHVRRHRHRLLHRHLARNPRPCPGCLHGHQHAGTGRIARPGRHPDLGPLLLEPGDPRPVLLWRGAPHLALGPAHQLCRLLDRLLGHLGRHHRPDHLASCRPGRLSGLYQLAGSDRRTARPGSPVAHPLCDHRLRRYIGLAQPGVELWHRPPARKRG